MKKLVVNLLKTFVVFVVVLLFISLSKTVYAAGCPAGVACLGSVPWDQPAGCKPHAVLNTDLSVQYYYFTQAYSRKTKFCDASCGWSDYGTMCDGGDWLTGALYWHNENFSGGCCADDSTPGPGPCDWGCYPNGDETVTCGGVCSPACSGATPRCCQKSICAATCYTVVPTNLSVTYDSGTKATLTWTPGGGGYVQKIYVGTSESVVRNGCPGGVGVAGCVVVKENIGKTQSSFTTTNVLVPGSTYYWMVVDYKNSSCFKNSDPYSSTYTPPVSPTCTLNLTGYPTVEAGGGTTTYTAAVTNILNGTVGQVNFVSNKTSVATVTSPDSSTPYTTTVTGVSTTGSPATITANAIMNGVTTCTDTLDVAVTNVGAWWQVKDGDVVTKGDLRSICI
jgi:hypothetical protein